MAKKILKVVTVTGADNSIKPEELILISKEFPFVEWGILLSKQQVGNKRFPSRWWLRGLSIFWRKHNFMLSGHICGRWVRALCHGDPSFFSEFGHLEMFRRIQLNFHAEPHVIFRQEFIKILRYGFAPRSIIFQMDGVNDKLFHDVAEYDGISAQPLFGTSGGCGILPKEWLRQPANKYAGYAGGLSPENIQSELERISQVADGPIWIDTETRMRSENDKLFDLKKVRRFLEAAKPWVIGQG